MKTYEQYRELDPYGEEDWGIFTLVGHFVGDIVKCKKTYFLKLKKNIYTPLIEGEHYKIIEFGKVEASREGEEFYYIKLETDFYMKELDYHRKSFILRTNEFKKYFD